MNNWNSVPAWLRWTKRWPLSMRAWLANRWRVRANKWAIGPNADALALHAANHPETIHLSENIFKVDPLGYVAGKHVGLAWFSPDCKHFSKAKGGKPVERNIRDLAWVIVLWAERAKPDVIINGERRRIERAATAHRDR